MYAFWQMWVLGNMNVFGILSQVGMYGERLPSKQYELVYQSIIINRKLALYANYFEVTIKSISKRYAKCGLWGMLVNVAKRWGYMFNACKSKTEDKFFQSIVSNGKLRLLDKLF